MRLLIVLMLFLPSFMGRAQFTFTTNANTTLTITGYKGSNSVVFVPSVLAGLPVSRIGDWAFSYTSAGRIVIPDSVTEIGDNAFSECIALTSVTLGNGVTNIGDYAFGFNSSLASVCFRGNAPATVGENLFTDDPTTVYRLPGSSNWSSNFEGQPVVLSNPPNPFFYATNSDGVTITILGYTGSDKLETVPSSIDFLPVSNIGNWAFYANSFLNILIPDSVTNIGDGAFFDCDSATNITLSGNITNIGDWAFAFCPNLTSVCCRGNAPNLGGDNVFCGTMASVYYLPGAIGWGQTFDDQPAVLWNPEMPFSYTITNDTVTTTGFAGSSGMITIPSTIDFLPVTTVGSFTFYSFSGPASVIIPDSVTSIENEAFDYCDGMTNLTIGTGVTNIALDAIVWCWNLQTFTVDAGNTNFSSTNGVLFNNDRTAIVQFPLGKNQGNYTIPAGVTRVGTGAFAYCNNLTSVIFGESVTNIEGAAFYGCVSLGNVTIPATITTIGPNAFLGCSSLTNVSLSNGLMRIGDAAFASCLNLPDLAIPDSVFSMGNDTFQYCSNLKSIGLSKNATCLGNETFEGCRNLANIVIPNGVTTIGSNTFYYCTNLFQLPVPDSLTNIEFSAFAYCGNLLSFNFPANTASVANNTFYACGSLTNVAIPYTITSIGDHAFDGCVELASVVLPISTTNIGSYAFSGCASLTAFLMPANVWSIGDGAFNYCTGLKEIEWPAQLQEIPQYAFFNCTNLTSITIPGGVTNIGWEAFDLCYALTSAYFGGNAPVVDGAAFVYSNPTFYYLPGTTGWDTMFAGVPTALWFLPNPMILNFEQDFGVQTNGFSFTISWATNAPVVVEACTNLVSPGWQAIQTNTLMAGAAYFSDPQWTNYSARFYRLRSP